MRYFLKHALYGALISEQPDPNLGLVVVIPSYNEPALLETLEALEACSSPIRAVEVIVVINHGVQVDAAIKQVNKETYEEAIAWKRDKVRRLNYHFLLMEDLPKKHAGVGLARKIGMDEAALRLVQVENEDGIIVCFDADCTCEENYLQEIEKYFSEHSKCPAVSIDFKHRLDGLPAEQIQAIEKYEQFLDYIVEQQKAAGYPYAFHTVGSSMAVTAWAYMREGGMNRRKAGEDFYFIHKFTAHPNFGEIKSTTVFPSARVSDRVPFGTGKAVGDSLSGAKEISFYNPQTFQDLKILIDSVSSLYKLEEGQFSSWTSKQTPMIQAFLVSRNFDEALIEIRGNATSEKTFTKRFFQWLNPFIVMKLMHFARDGYYENVEDL